MTSHFLYHFMIYIFALSLLFRFSDFISQNRRAKWMGTGLLVVVWVIQAVFFVMRMDKLDYIPIVTMFEVLFFFSWLLVTFSLVMDLLFRLEFFTFLLNGIAFSIMILNLLNDPTVVAERTGWVLDDLLLFLHIALAVLSYVAFTMSAIFAWMYLFLHRKLKMKQWSVTMRRLPSLNKIEHSIFRLIWVGIPCLLVSIVLGLIRMLRMGQISMIFEPNILGSFFIFAVYAIYIIQRMLLNNVSGTRLAWWNLFAYAVIVIHFMMSTYFSRFHQWLGM